MAQRRDPLAPDLSARRRRADGRPSVWFGPVSQARTCVAPTSLADRPPYPPSSPRPRSAAPARSGSSPSTMTRNGDRSRTTPSRRWFPVASVRNRRRSSTRPRPGSVVAHAAHESHEFRHDLPPSRRHGARPGTQTAPRRSAVALLPRGSSIRDRRVRVGPPSEVAARLLRCRGLLAGSLRIRHRRVGSGVNPTYRRAQGVDFLTRGRTAPDRVRRELRRRACAGVPALEVSRVARAHPPPVRPRIRRSPDRAELTGRDVPVVLDPTLAVDRAVWDRLIAEQSAMSAEPHAVRFFLGRPTPAQAAWVERHARDVGLALVDLHSLDQEASRTSVRRGSSPRSRARRSCTPTRPRGIFALLHRRPIVLRSRFDRDARWQELLSQHALTTRPTASRDCRSSTNPTGRPSRRVARSSEPVACLPRWCTRLLSRRTWIARRSATRAGGPSHPA